MSENSNPFASDDEVLWRGHPYSVVRVEGDDCYLSDCIYRTDASQPTDRRKVHYKYLTSAPDVDALRAENANWQALHDRIADLLAPHSLPSEENVVDTLARVMAERDALRARVTELEAALTLFAVAYHAFKSDEDEVDSDIVVWMLNWGDAAEIESIYKAAAALKGKQP